MSQELAYPYVAAHPCLPYLSLNYCLFQCPLNSDTRRFIELSLEEMKESVLVRPSPCSRLSVTFICCSSLILLDCINLIKHHKANLAFGSAKTLYDNSHNRQVLLTVGAITGVDSLSCALMKSDFLSLSQIARKMSDRLLELEESATHTGETTRRSTWWFLKRRHVLLLCRELTEARSALLCCVFGWELACRAPAGYLTL